MRVAVKKVKIFFLGVDQCVKCFPGFQRIKCKAAAVLGSPPGLWCYTPSGNIGGGDTLSFLCVCVCVYV